MPGCWVGSCGNRGIRGSTAVSGRRDVRAPGACVVERSSERGVSGGAERQRRQGRGACSTGIISGSGTQRGGRQCSNGDGTGQAGARASCGMMAAQLCAREAGTKQRSERRERREGKR